MITDLLGGQVDFVTAALPSVQQHLASGSLRAIGLGTAKRVPAAPDIRRSSSRACPATWSKRGSR
jgi:tripartite-type tricarboxylate transporter receptor subunit TctC